MVSGKILKQTEESNKTATNRGVGGMTGLSTTLGRAGRRRPGTTDDVRAGTTDDGAEPGRP